MYTGDCHGAMERNIWIGLLFNPGCLTLKYTLDTFMLIYKFNFIDDYGMMFRFQLKIK